MRLRRRSGQGQLPAHHCRPEARPRRVEAVGDSFAADRYRGTYEAILAGLRAGPVVHADEAWAPIKRPSRRGYVWVFANPTAAAYVYSPSRDGDTAREALAGFQGVLVSDFYSGYE